MSCYRTVAPVPGRGRAGSADLHEAGERLGELLVAHDDCHGEQGQHGHDAADLQGHVAPERPDREQTNTRLAATSYRELIIGFPDSPYAMESRARLGVMRGLLAEHEYLVGHFYLKRRAWRAAKGRMDMILAAYPEYAGLDKVLYEGGLLEGKMGNGDEARLLWQRLQKDYPASPLVKKVPAPTVSAPATVRAAGG